MSFFSTILNWLPMWRRAAEELKGVSAMAFDDEPSHAESKVDVDDVAAAMVVTDSESEWVKVQGVIPAILPPHVSHSAQRPYKLVSYR